MSNHEIRLRRQKLTSRGADRFRNYGAVMHRVEEEKRIKKILRVFGYFLVILILVMLLVIVIRLEKKTRSTDNVNPTSMNVNPGRFDRQRRQEGVPCE
jgi:hypothetical protein